MLSSEKHCGSASRSSRRWLGLALVGIFAVVSAGRASALSFTLQELVDGAALGHDLEKGVDRDAQPQGLRVQDPSLRNTARSQISPRGRGGTLHPRLHVSGAGQGIDRARTSHNDRVHEVECDRAEALSQYNLDEISGHNAN